MDGWRSTFSRLGQVRSLFLSFGRWKSLSCCFLMVMKAIRYSTVKDAAEDVHTVCIPLHTSNTIQPLDVRLSVYSLVKMWRMATVFALSLKMSTLTEECQSSKDTDPESVLWIVDIIGVIVKTLERNSRTSKEARGLMTMGEINNLRYFSVNIRTYSQPKLHFSPHIA